MSQDRTSLKARYGTLLVREKRHARAIALAVFPSRGIAWWEVVVLPLLVMSILSRRQVRDAFCENHLFTKRIALRGALDLATGVRERAAVLAHIHGETGRVLESAPEGLYTEAVRQAQHEEIELLLDHDLRLLQAPGTHYDDLVRSVFRTRTAYEAHLADLREREVALARTALDTMGAHGDPELAAEIQAATDEVRANEVEHMFGSTGTRSGGDQA